MIPGIKEPGLEKTVELSELRYKSGVGRAHSEEVSILQVSE